MSFSRRDVKRVGVSGTHKEVKLVGKDAGLAVPDLEVEMAKETAQLEESFIKTRAKDEGQRFFDATDSEFWFAVCFQSRAQKEAFLKSLGLHLLGDKYLDGEEVARALKVSLPEGPRWTAPKIPKRFVELAGGDDPPAS